MNPKLLVEKLIDCFVLLDNIDNKIERIERRFNDYNADLRDLQRQIGNIKEKMIAYDNNTRDNRE